MSGTLWIGWHFLAPLARPAAMLQDVWITTSVVFSTSLLAFWLLSRHLWLGQACWLVGLTVGLSLAIYRLHQVELAYLYTLIPLIAIVIMGWEAAVASEAVVLALVWRLAATASTSSFPGLHLGTIVFATLVTLMIGWILSRTIFNLTEWYIFSFAQAQQKVQEARQHRAQVLQLFKELDQAYYRLNRANTALVAARKTAEEAERFKTEFVTNVSHELRTPLNLIVGFTEMMITSPESYDGVQLPGPYRSDINAVYHSAQHLLALVDDVLDLARIEVGRLPLVREGVDIALLIEETVAIVRDYIHAKGLDLRVHLNEEIPTLWLDRLRIRQVLLNLLVNAARHTSQGAITLTTMSTDDELVVQVIDTGTGISEQDLDIIFEEFRSTEQPFSEWHSGTGLGIPISKKFVELHNGRMGVESTYGRGTTFWFTLPLGAGSQAHHPPSHQTGYQPVVRLAASERILVVVHEDAQMASLLERYLDGYRIVNTDQVEAGVQLVEEVKGLALLMPSDGPTATVPHDVLTLRVPLPSWREAAVAYGVRGILGKPVTRQDLLASLARLASVPARILIVDDDPDIGRLFNRMLRPYPGVEEILIAHHGAEALRLMRTKRPDLVLLDLVMPEMDGSDLLSAMALDSELAGIPVILISAKAQDYHQARLAGSIEIDRASGFELGEVIRAVNAVLTALTPGWQELGTKAPRLEEGSAG
jgi:signal transduction histidine kinase/CheY-like chemotaxis protein